MRKFTAFAVIIFLCTGAVVGQIQKNKTTTASSPSLRGTTDKVVELYVSPTGNDANRGTLESPFSSMTKAISSVKEIRKEHPDGQIKVFFRGGVYQMSSQMVIDGLRSENMDSPIVFSAYKEETPLFRGSIELTHWKKVTDRKILSRVAPEVRKRMVVTDLRKESVQDFGDLIKAGNRPELFYKGNLQTVSRWPNSGFAYGGKALGTTVVPPANNGNTGATEPIFEYKDQRIDRWAEEPNPLAFGYWFWDWDCNYQPILSVDTKKKAIVLKKTSKYRNGLRFYGLNLLCEMDEEGEWYLDAERGLLYWYPPKSVSPEKHPAEITFSVLKDRSMIQLSDCKNLILDGLSFAETRGDAIHINGGENCQVRNCRMENIGKSGIIVEGGSGHLVDGCFLSGLGSMGMHLSGGERETLTPADFTVSNNYIENFARFGRTYCPGIGADGCGVHVIYNHLNGSPSSAFAFGGCDMVGEFNIIENVVTESDDQGGFDLFLNPSFRGIILRYNHWKNITGGTHYGAAGIRLDDLITGVAIYGNVFENCGSHEFGAVQIHGGSENCIEDNLFFGCKTAVSFTPYGKKDWEETHEKLKEELYHKINIHSPLYLRKYPEIREFGKNIDVNIIRNNLLVDCPVAFFRDNNIQITADNKQIESDKSKKISYYCTKELLHPLGIRTIPLDEMGIKRNKWRMNK